MTDNQRILSDALPFTVSVSSTTGQALLGAVPSPLWDAVNRAESHEDIILAQDKVAGWISRNWRDVCPEMTIRFPR